MSTAEVPKYADYHRTVIAYHGTTTEIAEDVVDGEPFQRSENEDDWLGHGIYFWEWAPKQAWWWAKKRKRFEHPAVVGAIIRLGNCFDLLDPQNTKYLKEFHGIFVDNQNDLGIQIPENKRQYRRLDSAIFNFFYGEQEEDGTPIDSARGVYVPTAAKKRIWKGSWIYDDAHIQICVRNAGSILAVWHVKPDGRYGKQA